jgi:capsular exopolysaccharide synthesis family protein
MTHISRALEQAMRDRAQPGSSGRVPLAPVATPPVRHAPPVPEIDPLVRPPAEPAAARPAPPREPRASALSHGIDDHLVSLLTPASFIADQYRILRHLLEQRHRAAGFSIVAVSSPHVADGKTTTAINLAGALSQAPDARVLLVDLDLRHPSVAAQLGLASQEMRGLVDGILDPQLRLADVARVVEPFNFSVLLPGRPAQTPYEFLKASKLTELIEEARQAYDYVVIDTPPLLPVPDCQVIGKWVDGFLIVLACDRTPRRLLGEALGLLAPDRVLGIVFNGNDEILSSYGTTYHAVDLQKSSWRQAASRVGGSLRHAGRLTKWR